LRGNEGIARVMTFTGKDNAFTRRRKKACDTSGDPFARLLH
jgi:hypothetical protein